MTEIPSWGRVTAAPHEYLIQMRDGRVIRSGPGLSVFKWPGDSIALVPTSVRKLSFRADQVTLEKTGVDVTGLAVYRIVEPLLAFRMLDGDVGGLTEILRDMFVGATRRIVASLTLEECITHRKERVAAALLHEIAPVLAGEGRLDDTADGGWGVVLDTIEIQDVRVLSAEVFARLQAPYREKLALDAMRAKDEVTRENDRLEAERRRASEQQARALMQEQDARVEAERERAMQAQAHAEQLEKQELEATLARRRHEVEAERDRAVIEGETKKQLGELEAELVRLARAAQGDLSEARLREIALTQTLPQIAVALRGMVETVHVTTTDANVGRLLEVGTQALAGLFQRPRG
jgi:regulator of protease activity HflC (stomatin/prohibitin superfamily)